VILGRVVLPVEVVVKMYSISIADFVSFTFHHGTKLCMVCIQPEQLILFHFYGRPLAVLAAGHSVLPL